MKVRKEQVSDERRLQVLFLVSPFVVLFRLWNNHLHLLGISALLKPEFLTSPTRPFHPFHQPATSRLA